MREVFILYKNVHQVKETADSLFQTDPNNGIRYKAVTIVMSSLLITLDTS